MKVIDTPELTPDQVIAQAMQAKQKPTGKLLDKKLLPSRGVFYPNDIYVTPFTGMDLKDLTNITTNVNQVIYKILGKRIQGVAVNDILINDKLWFLYYIRDLTYKGKEIAVKCTCPNCGAQTVKQYTFDKLHVVHYDKHLPDKQLKMPNDDLVEFAFPTIGTEIQINRLKNDPNVIEAIDDQFMLLASYIKSINGKKQSIMDTYFYVQNVDAMTFCFIVNTLDKYSFVCDRTASFTCDCGAELNPIIEMDQDFFIPKLF